MQCHSTFVVRRERESGMFFFAHARIHNIATTHLTTGVFCINDKRQTKRSRFFECSRLPRGKKQSRNVKCVCKQLNSSQSKPNTSNKRHVAGAISPGQEYAADRRSGSAHKRAFRGAGRVQFVDAHNRLLPRIRVVLLQSMVAGAADCCQRQ